MDYFWIWQSPSKEKDLYWKYSAGAWYIRNRYNNRMYAVNPLGRAWLSRQACGRVKKLQSKVRAFFYLKLLPCSECCMFSFGWFPGAQILCADISEHSVCSKTPAHKIQMPGNRPEESIQQSECVFGSQRTDNEGLMKLKTYTPRKTIKKHILLQCILF